MQRRNLITWGAGLALTGLGLPAAAARAGEDYVVLQEPLAVPASSLVKLFAYDCPFCYKYDTFIEPKVLPQVLPQLGLQYMPMHIEKRGQYGRTASEFFAMCMLRDRDRGIDLLSELSLFKKTKAEICFAYNRRRERWTAGEGAFIDSMSKASGISAEEFAAVRHSAQVQALADSWQAAYPVAAIQGIPAYVVNGRYLVMTKSIRSIEGMAALITELAALS